MNRITKQFYTDNLKFISTLSADELNAQIEAFCKKGFWDFSSKINGKVKGNGKYLFSRKSQPIGGAELTAEVIPGPDGSVVRVKVSPPFFSAVGAVIFFIAGLVMICNSFSNGYFNGQKFMGSIAIIIIFPSIFAFRNYLTKNAVADNFADEFDLKPVDEAV